MNTYRYDEGQIRGWVRDKLTKAKSVKQICQEAAISRATLYNWLKEFPENGLPPAPVAPQPAAPLPVTTLEKAAKLPFTDPAARYHMMVTSLKKADLDGAVSRRLVSELVKRYTITVAQACEIVGIDEAAYGYRPRKPEVDDQLVYDAFLSLIEEEPSRSFIECYEILQKTQPDWTRKQLKRVYRERRLYLKRKRKTRSGYATESGEGVTITAPVRMFRPGATWNLGLVQQDAQWVLFILDNEDGTPLNARTGEGEVNHEDVMAFLDLAVEENGKPKKLRLFAKEPFANREITRWIWDNHVALHNLTLAKPENLLEMQTLEEKVRACTLAGDKDPESAAEHWLSSYA